MVDYNVNFSDGTPHTVPTGAIDNTYDIPLIGQDAVNYGDDLVTAQLRQLENFANNTAPSFGVSRVVGQLWYDTTATTGGLKVWDGATWDKFPLDTEVVHTTGAETIAGVKTFSAATEFTAAGAPFVVNSSTLVSNLNAEFLNGNADTAFATAAQGVLADNAEPDLGNPAVDGYVLSSTIAGIRSWIAPTAGTGNIEVIDAAADTTTFVVLAGTATGNQDPLSDAGLIYNASTNALTTTTFIGNLTGNADTATSATSATTATTASQVAVTDEAADTTTFVLFTNTATGNLAPHTNTALQFNSSTGAFAATSFSGLGTALTALNATNIASGTLAVARGGTGASAITGTGNNVLSASPTLSGTVVIPTINNGAGVSIQFSGSTKIVTQNNATLGNTSGATVVDHGGTAQDIGFNTIPQFNFDATDTLEASHCGAITGKATTTARTLTLAASGDLDFPVEGLTNVVNAFGSGDYTITEGSGTTLFYLDGTAFTDTAGGATLGPGGVATIYRFSSTVYYIWGSGITP